MYICVLQVLCRYYALTSYLLSFGRRLQDKDEFTSSVEQTRNNIISSKTAPRVWSTWEKERFICTQGDNHFPCMTSRALRVHQRKRKA